jgi:glucose-1-phosphatase
VARGPIEFVLFDLGGVLVELGGVSDLRSLVGVDDDEEFWHRWLASSWVRRLDTGECSADEFARGLVADWRLPVDPNEFQRVFALWPAAPFDGAEELLDEVALSVPIGCLSNTNRVHWDHQLAEWPLLARFDHRFLSFELGLVKPDPAIFEGVGQRLPVPPERTLFVDDNAANVEGARRCGFLAEQVRGVEGARRAIARAGVLPADPTAVDHRVSRPDSLRRPAGDR